MKLSTRLEKIFQLLVPNHEVWDLCCDHGLLGRKALQSGKFARVHFVDQVPHIIDKLEQTLIADFAHHETEQSWQTYAHPVENLKIPLVGNVVLTGVGGLTSIRILESIISRGILSPKRLILCPQDHRQGLENFLLSRFDVPMRQVEILENGRVRNLLILDFNTLEIDY